MTEMKIPFSFQPGARFQKDIYLFCITMKALNNERVKERTARRQGFYSRPL